MNQIKTCAVDGCERQARSRAATERVCLMHYKRWKRSGEFGGAMPTLTRNTDRQPCVVEDCDVPQDGNSPFCKLHDTRMRRHGDPLRVVQPHERAVRIGEGAPRWTGEDATYGGVHQRVRRLNGPAKGHPCVDGCGRPGAQWSYDRSDPDEKQSPVGPYSTDLSRYVARCVSCHKKFDLAALA